MKHRPRCSLAWLALAGAAFSLSACGGSKTTIGWAGEPVRVREQPAAAPAPAKPRDTVAASNNAKPSQTSPTASSSSRSRELSSIEQERQRLRPTTVSSPNAELPWVRSRTASKAADAADAAASTAAAESAKQPAAAVASSAPAKASRVGEKAAIPAAVAASVVPYAEVAAAHNERVGRLGRIWGRAVTEIRFKDQEGNDRWEQGEGHLQVVQPSKIALWSGKLGEVVIWIGSDNRRYWVIDAKQGNRAFIGDHTKVTPEKLESLALAAAPLDLLALMGVTPLPEFPKAKAPVVGLGSGGGETISFELERGGSWWRYTFDRATMEPRTIEIIAAQAGPPLVSATIEEYDGVKIKGDGTIPPRAPSRVRCVHHGYGYTLSLHISDMVDSGRGKFLPEVFDFETLRERLGVKDVVDLDAPRVAAQVGQDR